MIYENDTTRQIWEKFKNDPNQYAKEIEKMVTAYNIMDMLRKFSNIANEIVMEEFFPNLGKHQWNKFLKCNRNVIDWLNTLDSSKTNLGSRESFLIHLLFSEKIYAKELRN